MLSQIGWSEKVSLRRGLLNWDVKGTSWVWGGVGVSGRGNSKSKAAWVTEKLGQGQNGWMGRDEVKLYGWAGTRSFMAQAFFCLSIWCSAELGSPEHSFVQRHFLSTHTGFKLSGVTPFLAGYRSWQLSASLLGSLCPWHLPPPLIYYPQLNSCISLAPPMASFPLPFSKLP